MLPQVVAPIGNRWQHQEPHSAVPEAPDALIVHFADVSLGLPRVSVRFGVGLPNEMWLQSTVVPPDDTRFNGKKIVALAGDTYLWSTLPENNW